MERTLEKLFKKLLVPSKSLPNLEFRFEIYKLAYESKNKKGGENELSRNVFRSVSNLFIDESTPKPLTLLYYT